MARPAVGRRAPAAALLSLRADGPIVGGLYTPGELVVAAALHNTDEHEQSAQSYDDKQLHDTDEHEQSQLRVTMTSHIALSCLVLIRSICFSQTVAAAAPTAYRLQGILQKIQFFFSCSTFVELVERSQTCLCSWKIKA